MVGPPPLSFPALSLLDAPDRLIDLALDLGSSGLKLHHICGGVEPRIHALVPFLATRGGARGVHPLADPAMPLEVFLLRGDHLVEHIARLMADSEH